MNEFALIDLIQSTCALHRPDVRIGIGDDAAAIDVPEGHELLICTDTLVAGRHFPINSRAEDIGWKSLAVNLSDLAAMGGTPAFALLALCLPDPDEAWVRAFARGFSELASRHNVALIGGDTTRGPLTITVTALGFAPRGMALRRGGAKVGDVIVVTGALGAAAAGLHYLGLRPECGRAYRLDPNRFDHQCVSALDRPVPQIAQGIALRDYASSAIDISDGLAADLGHVLRLSDTGADIELGLLPGWQALCEVLAVEQATRLVLSGGDDYVLLATVPPNRLQAAELAVKSTGAVLCAIGHVSAEPGLRIRDLQGNLIHIEKAGWDHFA